MVKKALVLCSAVLITALLILPVSARSSATLVNRQVYSGSSYLTFTDSPKAVSTWHSSMVSSASSLGFSVAGWENFFVDGDHYVSASYDWSADANYLLLFRYKVFDGNTVIINCGYNQSLSDEEKRGSYSSLVDLGTYSFMLTVDSFTYSTDSFETDQWADSSTVYKGDTFTLSFPVFAPLYATTEEQMLEMMEDISGKLDDLSDGLFSPTPEQSEVVGGMQSTVDDTRSRVDQALFDASIPSFDYSLPEISIDPAPVEPVTNFLEGIPFLVPILGVGVACWITHLILYGKG